MGLERWAGAGIPGGPMEGDTGEEQVCVVLPVTDGSSSPGVDSLQPAGQTQTVFV